MAKNGTPVRLRVFCSYIPVAGIEGPVTNHVDVTADSPEEAASLARAALKPLARDGKVFIDKIKRRNSL